MQDDKTLIAAIKRMSDRIGVPLEKIAERLPMSGGGSGENGATGEGELAVYNEAISDPREEVILCYTVGDLWFVPGKDAFGNAARYGILDMKLYQLDGTEDGRYLTVWQPDPAVSVDELYGRPDRFTGPFNKPARIPPPSLRANSLASYHFKSLGGTIYATGPANLLLTPFTDGSQVFQVSVASYITGGEGAFEGCRGVNTALGTSFVPEGMDLFNLPFNKKIPGMTISTFRLVREENIGDIPE
jgi:hypothetical protein